jgi:hypothetical protein
VAKEVTAAPLVDAAVHQAGTYFATEPIATDGSADRREEEVMGISVTHELRAHGPEVET